LYRVRILIAWIANSLPASRGTTTTSSMFAARSGPEMQHAPRRIVIDADLGPA
jgi:hypothetical protein